MASPWILGFIIFVVGPMIVSLYLSFTRWDLFTAPKWIGTDPFAWTLSTALKAPDDVFAFPPQWIPDPVVWTNFSDAVTTRPFGRWFLNTLFVVGISTFGTVLSASMVAFSFAQLRWPGRNILFLILLATMMLLGNS